MSRSKKTAYKDFPYEHKLGFHVMQLSRKCHDVCTTIRKTAHKRPMHDKLAPAWNVRNFLSIK